MLLLLHLYQGIAMVVVTLHLIPNNHQMIHSKKMEKN